MNSLVPVTNNLDWGSAIQWAVVSCGDCIFIVFRGKNFPCHQINDGYAHVYVIVFLLVCFTSVHRVYHLRKAPMLSL